MTDFKIGDVVRLKTDTDKSLGLIVRGIGSEAARSVNADALCVSQCGMRFLWAKFDQLELVHRPDPQADIKQAIREVLLSEEFMKAFAAAWMKTPIPMAMHFDENYRDSIKSLTHRPFVEPATEATNDPT